MATLVARGLGPEPVLAAVAEEVGALFDVDLTAVARFEPDGEATLLAGHGLALAEAGVRAKPDPGFTSVRETGRAARFEVNDPSARLPDHIRAEGVRALVAAPITVEGRLWGAITVASRGEEPPGPDTEARLAGFTELVATAIANAEAKAELTASRARIVATADQTRRRIERDLHDGAQQRLVSLALRLRTASAAIPGELEEVLQELATVGAELDGVLGDLRELSRGIHPAILAEGGLGPALRTLARRSSVPVQLQVGSEGRLPERVEVTAYYVAAEALTNVAKHAGASVVQVQVDTDDGLIRLDIRDDGVGGADPARGTGLVGLKDRVEANGGTLRVQSPPARAPPCWSSSQSTPASPHTRADRRHRVNARSCPRSAAGQTLLVLGATGTSSRIATSWPGARARGSWPPALPPDRGPPGGRARGGGLRPGGRR